MSNSKTIPFGKMLPLGVYFSSISLNKLMNFVVSFLVGQAFVFKTLNPFVIPYLVVQINRKKGSFAISLVSAYLGVIVGLIQIIDIGEFLGLPYFQAYLTQYTVAFALIISSRVIFEKSKIKFTKNVKLFISFVSSIASCFVILAFENFGTYYLMIGVYVAVASIVIPMFIGEGAYILTLNIPKGKTKLNDSELFSLALFMTIILIGSTKIGFNGFSLFLTILVVYILNLAFILGGIVSGIITLVTVGLFAVLTTNVDSNIVLFTTLATVLAGFVGKEKKHVVITFGITIGLIYFFNKQMFFGYNLLTIAVSYVLGSVLFLLSPTKMFSDVATLGDAVSNITDDIDILDYENFTKEFRVDKIFEYKNGADKLEKIIENIDIDEGYSCDCTECLTQREKLRTFKNLMLQSSGLVKNTYNDLINEFHSDIVFYKNLESDIMKSLTSRRVKFLDIKITKNQYDKYQVVLFVDRYPILQTEREILNEVLLQHLNTKFIQMPTITQSDKHTKVYFNEKYDFTFGYGIAMKTKDGGKVSGDSYSILDLENHCNVIALSDGMGAGESAKNISSTTLNLLDDLLVANMKVDDAIKIVNSLLVIKSKDEEFATLDLCEINKYTGDCNFYKVGSAQTYVLRNNKVKAINSDSLPIGIIENIDIKLFKFKVRKGDYIIMVTDGISEMDKEKLDKDKWLTDALENLKARQPQDIADLILSKASKINDGIEDDKTVLVCRVY